MLIFLFFVDEWRQSAYLENCWFRNSNGRSDQREGVMGQFSLAVDKPAVAVRSYRQNIIPFNTARYGARVRFSPATQPRLSEGVVVRLPKAPRAHKITSKRRAESSDSGEMRFTTLDYVATTFLILSVFAAPALVWSLVRAASLG
jgi:hypothetical protein